MQVRPFAQGWNNITIKLRIMVLQYACMLRPQRARDPGR